MYNLSHENNFIFSNAGWIIAEVNGSLSVLSSILIMSIIIRSSPEARSSAYHIIMFFMSFSDVIMSGAMAFHTIPMPSSVYETYPFAGKALGSVVSCEAQGFLIDTGMIFVLLSNTTLNLYYVCTLKYGMAEDRFKKRIMPVMLVLSLALVVLLPVNALRMDFINPSPLTGVCMVTSYPLGCSTTHTTTTNSEHIGDYTYYEYSDGEEGQGSSGMECIRGDSIFFQNMYSMVSNITIGGVFTIMLISLVLVTASVFKSELSIRKSKRIQRTSRLIESTTSAQDRGRKLHDFENTRAIMTQALMYIFAFLLTYVWIVIILAKLPIYSGTSGSQSSPSSILTFLVVFFQPLQGFFNAIIFIYHKAYTLRQVHTDLGLFGASKHVIVSPSTVPEQVIDNIEIAIEEIGVRRQEEENTRMHRGQSSISLREREMARMGSGRLKRFGILDSRNIDDKGFASAPNSIYSSGDDDGSFSSRCLSSLGDVLGPDDDDDDDDHQDDLISLADSNTSRRCWSFSSDFSPIPNEEDLSSASSLNASVNVHVLTWSPDLCSIIPEEDEGDTTDDVELN